MTLSTISFRVSGLWGTCLEAHLLPYPEAGLAAGLWRQALPHQQLQLPHRQWNPGLAENLRRAGLIITGFSTSGFTYHV